MVATVRDLGEDTAGVGNWKNRVQEGRLAPGSRVMSALVLAHNSGPAHIVYGGINLFVPLFFFFWFAIGVQPSNRQSRFLLSRAV